MKDLDIQVHRSDTRISTPFQYSTGFILALPS